MVDWAKDNGTAESRNIQKATEEICARMDEHNEILANLVGLLAEALGVDDDEEEENEWE